MNYGNCMLQNHSCRRKAISTTYAQCVWSLSYPACKGHKPYSIVICGLYGCTIFFHIISHVAQFSEKVIEHIMCVLTFS